MKKILIAEDSASWQNAHKDLLSKYDSEKVEFKIFPSARDALNELQNPADSVYDLIITDLQMENDFLPEFAGEWFIKNVKELPLYKNKPIVIVSAAYNISFIAAKYDVNYLSKRLLVSNPESYFYMLDEIFLSLK